jgi:Flp pilus assembly protein TadD
VTPPVKPAPAPAPVVTASAHETLGRSLTQAGKYSDAIAELTQAIQLKPELATAYNARGYVYLLQHDYQHALSDFNEAIRLKPAYTNASQNRSVALKALGTN